MIDQSLVDIYDGEYSVNGVSEKQEIDLRTA